MNTHRHLFQIEGTTWACWGHADACGLRAPACFTPTEEAVTRKGMYDLAAVVHLRWPTLSARLTQPPTKENHMRPTTDREAITLILTGLTEKGCKVTQVADDTWNPNDLTDVTTVAEAVDLVMGVDEATVYVDLPSGKRSFIYFVLGNDPEEVACDYGVRLDEYLAPIMDPWWE